MPESLKPQPKNINVVCTVCALDYAAHGADPTLEDCIRLLRAELAKRPHIMPSPSPVPWRPTDVFPAPRAPWQNPVICRTTGSAEGLVHAI